MGEKQRISLELVEEEMQFLIRQGRTPNEQLSWDIDSLRILGAIKREGTIEDLRKAAELFIAVAAVLEVVFGKNDQERKKTLKRATVDMPKRKGGWPKGKPRGPQKKPSKPSGWPKGRPRSPAMKKKISRAMQESWKKRIR